MATITFKGDPIHTAGTLPAVGAMAPDFTLTDGDLADRTMADYRGKKIVMNIFPSIDTSVCAMSVRRFNAEAAARPGTVILCISADLPFASSRFCGAEGLDKVVTLSDFRHKEFGTDYGVRITDSPLAGLLARSVLIIDEQGQVVYSQQVPEIGQEPDYDAALVIL
jgi:thiol peroxidase